MEFVSDLPPKAPLASRTAPYLEELRRNPGQWAAVARYPREKASSARSRGFQFNRRYPDVEYAVRTLGDEAVLYMRAVAS